MSDFRDFYRFLALAGAWVGLDFGFLLRFPSRFQLISTDFTSQCKRFLLLPAPQFWLTSTHLVLRKYRDCANNCLKENGCLFYNSSAYWWWVLQAYSTENIITLLLSNLWPLTIESIIESRVQSMVQSRVQSPGFVVSPHQVHSYHLNIIHFRWQKP